MEWKVQDYLYSLEGMQCMSRIFWNKVFNLQLLRVLALVVVLSNYQSWLFGNPINARQGRKGGSGGAAPNEVVVYNIGL